MQCFSLQATFNSFPNNILNKNIFKTKALQRQANLWLIFSILAAVTKSFCWFLHLTSRCPHPITRLALPLLIWGIDYNHITYHQSLVDWEMLLSIYWKLFQPDLSSACSPGRALISPLGPARFPVSLYIGSKWCNKTLQLCRRLHQRKQNFEIYKFLKQQILVKTEEVKVLREKEKELKTFKRSVRKYSYQIKLVLLP